MIAVVWQSQLDDLPVARLLLGGSISNLLLFPRSIVLIGILVFTAGKELYEDIGITSLTGFLNALRADTEYE